MQTEKLTYTKICVNPQCEAIYHNINKKNTRCNDCDGYLIIINKKTYLKKFVNNYFQYDYNTMEYFYPVKQPIQLELF